VGLEVDAGARVTDAALSTTAELVLITTNHPFTHTGGEVMFIGPELKRLARELDAVRVVPLHAQGERVEVPAGVQVDTSLSDAMQRERISGYLRALWWPGIWLELMRAARHGGWTGCARVWRWAATAQTTYRWARKSYPLGSAALFYTYWRGGSTMALARLAGEQAGVKVVTRVHRYELYEDAFDPPFQPWHPSLYHSVALTATVSKDGYDYLRKAGVGAERLILSRLGTEAPPTLARASGDGVLRIVSASFVTPVKRVPLIAQAVLAFAARYPAQRVEWTHFGDGPQLDLVRQLLISAPVNFTAHLRGHIANAVVMAHYASQAVDVFLLLSESEGLPVSIQEAASAGVPLIATDVGGVRELVGGDNGVLLNAHASILDVVVALERLLLEDSMAERQAKRSASHRRWSEGFNAELNHTNFTKTLKRWLSSLPKKGEGRGGGENSKHLLLTSTIQPPSQPSPFKGEGANS
jgi:glycosyltransferase involved in cell wall biosynthesis